MTTITKIIANEIRDSLSNKELDRLSESDEYANFIMANCNRDRVIYNGDSLLCAMEDGYLFDEFLVDNKYC
jgi:hypothetical protein